MTNTNPDDVRQFLRELGNHIGQPERIVVGGSIALILSGQLSRYTEHLDVVDEVPLAIRQEHEVLDEMARRYGLRLAHFQSHYLPDGWEQGLISQGDFGRLRVDLVDSYDILVGKLFSPRTKDRDDLRVLSRQLEKAKIEARLRDSGMRLLADPTLADNASKNWYILYGEELPR